RNDVVGLGGGRTVGALDQDPGADQVGVVVRDLAFEGGRDENVGLQGPEFIRLERLGVRHADHAAVLVYIVEQHGDVQPAGVVYDSSMVVDGDDLLTGLME